MLRITALNRGGLAVYGPGHYDAKNDQAVIETLDGETLAVQIEYPSAPSSLMSVENGVSAGSISVSGNVASFLLSDITEGGGVSINASVGGATRIVAIGALTGAASAAGAESADIPDLDAIFEGALT